MKRNMLVFCIMVFLPVVVFSQTIPEMIQIPAGAFIMGDDNFPPQKKIEKDGIPLESSFEHEVMIDPLSLSKYEITFTEFFRFLRDTGYITDSELQWFRYHPESTNVGDIRKYYNDKLYPDYPAVEVSYEDALMYCLWLSRKTGKLFRLPTEAEWEYAATGGKMQLFPWGSDYRQFDKSHTIDDDVDAWFKTDVFPVTAFKEDKSDFGVYGMFGNVGEWCLDAYDPEFYLTSPMINPLQVIRKYENNMSYRSSVGYAKGSSCEGVKGRKKGSPFYATSTMGFRIVEETVSTIFNKGTESSCTFYYSNGIVNDSNVNIRNSPSLDGKKLFQFPKGEEVRIYFRSSEKMTIGNITDYWYCVRRLNTIYESKMSTGWIFGAYLNINKIEFNSN